MVFILKHTGLYETVVPMKIYPLTAFVLILGLSCIVLQSQSYAMPADFSHWKQSFRAKAIAHGINPATVDNALATMHFLPKVIELDRRQPEGSITLEKYHRNILTRQRIDQGRRLYKKHYQLLQQIGKKYGVQPAYIVALWGVETNYGGFTGGTHTLSALATLAYEGRRKRFFETELINALTIIQQGHVSAKNMRGSWAGALGQNQFMPSSFLRFAVDEDNDSHKDIWTTKRDVFASTANYLSQSGWHEDQRWGRQVLYPAAITHAMMGNSNIHPLEYWKSKGVTTLSGKPIPVVAGMKAALIQPDGAGGKAYLVYDNFRTLLKWNKSSYFATTVGLLADSIAAAQP